MLVDICGTRGSTPAPGAGFIRYGGHTSCLALTADGDERPTLILDAGTGIRPATDLFGDHAFEGTILFSHLHWDHTQGLPFFAAGDREDTRARVLIPDQPRRPDALAVLARMMSPPHFPIDPTELRGAWTFAQIAPGEHRVGAFSVLAREVPHRGRTFGYRISDGRATLAYMPDHRPTALGAGPDGLGAYHPAALELAAGVDVLVHDSQLTRAELPSLERYGHACMEYPIELARQAGARSVLLFHHAPERTDEELDELSAAFPATPPSSFAVQGQVLRL